MKRELSGLILLLAIISFLGFLLSLSHEFSITGGASGVAKVEVICLTTISLPLSSVDFGQVAPGIVDDTADNNPSPMVIQNDGQIRTDISIQRDSASNPLFSGTGGGDNSSSFKFKIADFEYNSFNKALSAINWTNVPGTDGMKAIDNLKYSDSNDTARIDLRINVPGDEPFGSKNETLLFIAAASSGATCGDENSSSNDASCLSFDLMPASISQIIGGDDLVILANEHLRNIGLSNNCGRNITLTQMKMTWNSTEKVREVKFVKKPPYSVWKEDCNWGCSPDGKQISGAILDFGSHDYVLDGYSTDSIDEIIFDSDIRGNSFNIEFTLSDSSTKSTGYFTP